MKHAFIPKSLSPLLRVGVFIWVVVLAMPGRANPDNTVAKHAFQLLSNELVEEARPLVQSYLKSNSDPVTAKILQAHLHFLDNRFEDALLSLKEARAISGSIPE